MRATAVGEARAGSRVLEERHRDSHRNSEITTSDVSENYA